jgi:hypothetical protein
MNKIKILYFTALVYFKSFFYIIPGSWDSSVGIATGYGLDNQEGREFESW